MDEQYIDPHWLFDDDSDDPTPDDTAEENHPIEVPQEAEWDESDEWQERWAEDASVAVEVDAQEGRAQADDFLLDGQPPRTEPEPASVPPAMGPLTRRLAHVNASRPLRSAPVTLRLTDTSPVTIGSLIAGESVTSPSAKAGSRSFGCSRVGLLLVLLCLSSIAILLWSGIGPGQPTTAHHPTSATPPTASAVATTTAAFGRGITPTPGVTPSVSWTPGPGIKPTPTTTTATPTATVSPYAQSATITFTDLTQALSSSPSLTAYPSGCAIPAVLDTPSRSFLHSQHTTGGSPYWAVDILFTTGSSGHVGSVSPYGTVNNGATVTCQNAPFNVNLGGNQSAWFQCVPTIVPVRAYAFNCSTCFGFTYSNPNGSYQDTSNEYVTPQDCSSAQSAAQGQATSWEQSYSPNVGPQLVAESTWTDTLSCSPMVNQHGTTVTGSAWGHVSAEGFNPADARTIALADLDALLPSSYIWKSSGTSASGANCAPTWSAPASGSTTFGVTCVDTDVAVQVWTSTSEQQLAASLAGMPLNQAIQTCNAATHSTCHIALSGGNGQAMPVSAASIAIMVT